MREPTKVGIFFKEVVMEGRGVSDEEVAPILGMTKQEFSDFIKGGVRCDRMLSKKLAEYTGTSTAFWNNMQGKYDSYKEFT